MQTESEIFDVSAANEGGGEERRGGWWRGGGAKRKGGGLNCLTRSNFRFFFGFIINTYLRFNDRSNYY